MSVFGVGGEWRASESRESAECDRDQHDCGSEQADGKEVSAGVGFGHFEGRAEDPHEDDAEQAACAVEDVGERGAADLDDAIGHEDDLRAEHEGEACDCWEERAFV